MIFCNRIVRIVLNICPSQANKHSLECIGKLLFRLLISDEPVCSEAAIIHLNSNPVQSSAWDTCHRVLT